VSAILSIYILQVHLSLTPLFSSLEVPGAAKSRREVRLEGYDSDSSHASDDGGARKAGAGGGDADEDEDMFASTAATTARSQDDLEEDTRIKDSGLNLREGTKKAGKDFLELGDIEGQEFHEEGEGDDADESFEEGDEHANADDAPRSRRSKEGMGYVLRFACLSLLCICR
jgi:CD2 antigen cytoplasmic tail-binding protein 2